MSALCSVCFVRAQRDDDDFLPCSPRCFQAALAEGYAAGVQAARDAADTQRSKFKARDWDDAIDAVVAAIDALRGES